MQMNQLNFVILPSPISNDHQVLPVIDGENCLGDKSLGIDPLVFLRQKSLRNGGRLLIGRCLGCGCIGCEDVVVDVSINGSMVEWVFSDGTCRSFDSIAYESAIDRQKNDFSWEDYKRRTERLVNGSIRGASIGPFQFQWASARIKSGFIVLSFMREDEQKLYDVPWDDKSAETAISNVKAFLNSTEEDGTGK
jgi:hypothetical protein